MAGCSSQEQTLGLETQLEETTKAISRKSSSSPIVVTKKEEAGSLVNDLEEKTANIYQEALSLYRQGEYSAALGQFKEVNKLIPGYSKAGYYITLTEKKIKKNKTLVRREALRQEEEILRQKEQAQAKARQEKISALYKQGIDLYNQQDYSGAQAAFNQIIELDPEHSAAKSYLETRIPRQLEQLAALKKRQEEEILRQKEQAQKEAEQKSKAPLIEEEIIEIKPELLAEEKIAAEPVLVLSEEKIPEVRPEPSVEEETETEELLTAALPVEEEKIVGKQPQEPKTEVFEEEEKSLSLEEETGIEASAPLIVPAILPKDFGEPRQLKEGIKEEMKEAKMALPLEEKSLEVKPDLSIEKEAKGEVTIATLPEEGQAVVEQVQESKEEGVEERPESLNQEKEILSREKKSAYYLAPDDVLEISVYGEPDLSVTLQVSEAGTIRYPLLGEIKVGELTAGEAAEKIEKLLEAGYLVAAQVNVLVKEYGKVYVVGAVNEPGVYDLSKNDLTPLDAINFLAGGLKDNANKSRVKIYRKAERDRKEIIVNLEDQTRTFFIDVGDRIVVDEYKDIAIFGEVKEPGKYAFRKGLTVVDAISLAGGFTEIASQNGVRVVRQVESGKKTIKVPVGYILRRGDRSKDLELNEGDTIVVPESWF